MEREPCQFFSSLQLIFTFTIFITSGISIVIKTNFTIIEKFIPLYMPIINLSNYLLPTLLHPTKNKMWYQHIYNNDWQIDGLFLISYHFYSTTLYSSNM